MNNSTSWKCLAAGPGTKITKKILVFRVMNQKILLASVNFLHCLLIISKIKVQKKNSRITIRTAHAKKISSIAYFLTNTMICSRNTRKCANNQHCFLATLNLKIQMKIANFTLLVMGFLKRSIVRWPRYFSRIKNFVESFQFTSFLNWNGENNVYGLYKRWTYYILRGV